MITFFLSICAVGWTDFSNPPHDEAGSWMHRSGYGAGIKVCQLYASESGALR